MRNFRSVLTGCLLVLVANTALAQSPRAYYSDDLGTLGGTLLLATAMNNNGDIVGSGTTADGTRHAFRWTRSRGLEDLGTFGGVASLATGINDSGDILGFYLDEQFQPHAFILPAGGTMQPIDGVSEPSGLAANGWFTGMSANSQAFRAVLGGVIQDLTAILGLGTAVNGRGDTTGWSWHDDPQATPPTAFRYSDAAGFVDLGTFGGAWSYAYGINAAGTVVGEASTLADERRAFRAAPGSPLQDLGTILDGPGSGAVAYGVNDASDVVGQAESMNNGVAPFRYTDGEGMVNLTPLIPIIARKNGPPYSAIAINARKEILAIYSGVGDLRTELLRPRAFVNPPDVSAVSADPAVLAPPDGRMVSVAIGVSVADEYDDNPACRITSVFDSASPFGGPDRDVQITGPLTLNLRAKRDGGDDRTYAVIVTCSNYFGKSATRFTLVRVPRR
jgi:probable HAF family extracellular repeat protein